MKTLFTLIALVGSAFAAASLTVYPSAISVPRGTYQTVSVTVTGVDNKGGTWTADGGSLIGNTTCTSAMAMVTPCTIALYSTTASTYHVTFTASDSTTAQSTITVTASPTALTTHPRLVFKNSDLASLQAKAVAGNQAWTTINNRFTSDATTWDAYFATGSGGGGYTCDGGTGTPNASWVTNAEGLVINPGSIAHKAALMANIDPNSTNRARWACRAHDWYMATMNEILKTSCGSGLCNTNTLNANYGADWGTGIGETLDWVYSSFSSGDKTTILSALNKAAKMIRTNCCITSSYPTPIGTINNSSLATDYGYIRTTGNNYYMYHMAMLASIGAAIDPADDPTVTNCAGGRYKVCTDGTANSLQAYLVDAVGAYLYIQWLNFEDPSITTTAYNSAFGSSLSQTFQCSATPYITLNTNCFGNGRGGLGHEGSMYMGSFQAAVEMNLFLATAGLLDPLNFAGTGIAMPQLSFATSSWWDMMVQGSMHLTTPVKYSSSYPLLFAYGETGTMYDNSGFLSTIFGILYSFDSVTGRSDRANQTGWLYSYLPSKVGFTTLIGTDNQYNKYAFLYGPNSSDIWGSMTAAGDPRTSMPLGYWSQNSGYLVSASGWSNTSTIFTSNCPIYPSQDHELGMCGRFSLYKNGDWITKGLDGYAEQDNNNLTNIPDYSNQAAYMNSPTSGNFVAYYLDPQWQRGGQGNHQFSNAINTNTYSDLPSYMFQHLDYTGGENFIYPCVGSCSPKTDVSHASRDFFFDKSQYLWIYDRGTTGNSAAKHDWFITTGTPTIVGSDVSWNSSLSAATAYLHNLLPVGATVTTQAFDAATTAGPSVIASPDYAPVTRILIEPGGITTVTDELQTVASNGSFSYAARPTNYDKLIAITGVKYASSGTALTEATTTGGLSAGKYIVSGNVLEFSSADNGVQMKVSYTYSASTSTSARFLNVIEAKGFGVAATGATLVQSNAGTAFDGAKVGSTCVMFKQNMSDTFSGTTYPASSCTQNYVTNLTPGNVYSLSAAGAPASCTADSAGVCSFASTGTGNINVGGGAAPQSPTAPSPMFAKAGNRTLFPHPLRLALFSKRSEQAYSPRQ